MSDNIDNSPLLEIFKAERDSRFLKGRSHSSVQLIRTNKVDLHVLLSIYTSVNLRCLIRKYKDIASPPSPTISNNQNDLRHSKYYHFL